jgi:hypothetical protein
MGSSTESNQPQLFPFATTAVGGNVTAVDPIARTVTTNGAATIVSTPMDCRKFSVFSMAIQQSGTSGASAGTWKIEGSNDFDPTRPVQQPGHWTDFTTVNATFGHNAGAVAGADRNDFFFSYTNGFSFLRFTFAATAGPVTTAAQFTTKSL